MDPGGDPLSIAGIAPGILVAGSTVDVTVTGTGIEDGTIVEVCRNGGVTSNLVTVPDSTMLVANVTVTNADGVRDVLPRGSITIQ